MSLLTEQEIQDLCYMNFNLDFDKRELTFARAIEAKARAKLLEEIKAQGAFIVTEYDPYLLGDGIWLEGIDKAYFFPYGTTLYRLPEGD